VKYTIIFLSELKHIYNNIHPLKVNKKLSDCSVFRSPWTRTK